MISVDLLAEKYVEITDINPLAHTCPIDIPNCPRYDSIVKDGEHFKLAHIDWIPQFCGIIVRISDCG